MRFVLYLKNIHIGPKNLHFGHFAILAIGGFDKKVAPKSIEMTFL